MEAIQLHQDVKTPSNSFFDRRREIALDCTHLYFDCIQQNTCSTDMSTTF